MPEVNTSQSNVSSRRSPGRAAESAGGRISTVGAIRTSAPSASSSAAERSASSIGRVTTIRWPNRGSSSNQFKAGRRATTSPTTSRAGGPSRAWATRSARSASVPTTVRCRASVPDLDQAAGVVAGFPSGSRSGRGSGAGSPPCRPPASPGTAPGPPSRAGRAPAARSGSSWPVTKATAEAVSR